VIRFRKMTPSEIAERDDKAAFEKMTHDQIRREHYARDDNPSKAKPKPKRRKKT
jgi:hypothetical protein